MFRNILVPVDLTDRHGSGREDEPAFYERLEKKARGHLERLAETLRAQQITARTDLLFGHPGREVIRYAQEHGCDLIVLMSHPVDVTQPGLGWNTLSYFIGVAARCPVLLVK